MLLKLVENYKSESMFSKYWLYLKKRNKTKLFKNINVETTLALCMRKLGIKSLL